MKTREAIIAENPIAQELERRGIQLRRQGAELVCCCPLHEDTTPSFRVNAAKALWTCDPCGIGGSVIDLVMKLDGLSVSAAMVKLGGEDQEPNETGMAKNFLPPVNGAPKIVAKYLYTDESGKPLYEVCRYEPKTFRQRHKKGGGDWIWSMEGVRRVLYNLPAVRKSDFVWIVEGEKDADTLNGHGFCATTNVGGAGKWEASYTETLRDKDIVLCGDNDEAGEKHVTKVLAALGGIVRTTRRIRIPEQYKDVTAWLEKSTAGGAGLTNLAEGAEVLTRGIRLPIKSMDELEREYQRFIATAPLVALRISDWLPSTLAAIRPIVPGELVTIIAGTGVGKTMVLQNIALNTAIPTLLFELELPGTLTFERFVSMALREHGRQVEEAYYENRAPNWRGSGKLGHIHVCLESKMTTLELERIINNAGLKTGMRPALVLLDYIQLIQGKGDRRERISDAAEELKVIAKATNTIIICASQIARKKGDEDGPVSLSDGKESGSIENSSGLVLGLWKESKSRIMLKVLKNTKGVGGKVVACDIKDGLVIEEAPTKDQPKQD